MIKLVVWIFFTLLFIIDLQGQCLENNHSTHLKDQWESCTTSLSPNSANGTGHWIQYDFGESYTLSTSHVWNYNVMGATNKGFNSVKIEHSINGTNWTTLGTYTWPQASGNQNYAGFPGPDFGSITARYVLVTALSNHGGTCSGLAELKIDLIACDAMTNVATLKANIWLEGFYKPNLQAMQSTLLPSNLLPMAQPFNSDPYFYLGDETLSYTMDVVDWILLELRSAADPTQIVAKRAGLLLADGTIVDQFGKPCISFNYTPAGTYYIAVRPRTNLSVISASPVTLPNLVSYDFTIPANVAGNEQLKQLPNGVYVAYAGDYDRNVVINAADYNLWKSDSAATLQYLTIDGDGNGVVNSIDYNLWYANRSKVGNTWLME